MEDFWKSSIKLSDPGESAWLTWLSAKAVRLSRLPILVLLISTFPSGSLLHRLTYIKWHHRKHLRARKILNIFVQFIKSHSYLNQWMILWKIFNYYNHATEKSLELYQTSTILLYKIYDIIKNRVLFAHDYSLLYFISIAIVDVNYNLKISYKKKL